MLQARMESRTRTGDTRIPGANLDGEIVALGLRGVLRVGPTVVRSFEAGPEGLDLIRIGGRRPDGGDSSRSLGVARSLRVQDAASGEDPTPPDVSDE